MDNRSIVLVISSDIGKRHAELVSASIIAIGINIYSPKQ